MPQDSIFGAAARPLPNGRRSDSARRWRADAGRQRDPVVPERREWPAFLVGENFEVIKRYNISDVFALAASQIADRAQGVPAWAAWPANDPQLTRSERIGLQKRMKELGHPVNDFDGRIDFDLRDEIRLKQANTAWCRMGTRHGS